VVSTFAGVAGTSGKQLGLSVFQTSVPTGGSQSIAASAMVTSFLASGLTQSALFTQPLAVAVDVSAAGAPVVYYAGSGFSIGVQNASSSFVALLVGSLTVSGYADGAHKSQVPLIC